MSAGHDIWDAVPPTGEGTADKTKLRNTITARMPYVLNDADNPEDLIAVDPETGSAIVDIFYLGRLFHYDPTDTATEGDGISCIVSNDGRRYKLSDGADVFAYSVLDNDLSAPPADPVLGDAHLVADAATGDWAGHEGEVAVYTVREWEFINFGIGRLLYIESSDSYVHRKTDGSWASGFGNFTIGTNSVSAAAAINFGNRFIVENQTTTTLPSTATVGTAYVRSSDLKLAVCEVTDNFTIYTPKVGWAIFDKNTNASYTWNGTAWLSTAGTWIDRKATPLTTSGSTTAPNGSSYYSYSATTAPTTSHRRLNDDVTLSFTAKKSGARLRIHYSAAAIYTATGSEGTSNTPAIALFVDSSSNASAWQMIGAVRTLVANNTSIDCHLDYWFEIDAPDASSHTYKISLLSFKTPTTNYSIDAGTLTRRLLEIEEAA